MRVLVAPDKFKGTLSALEVATAIANGMPGTDVACLPLADGGDGSVAAAVAAGFRSVPIRLGDRLSTEFAARGDTAVVELANTCGMQTLPGGVPDPMGSSTHGLGQALRAALDSGARRIVLALGGSASTDGGAGMLAALGARFFGAEGERFDPSGGTLARLERVDLTDLIDLSGIELLCATDVRNPLLGATGAAAVFGPQKGASAAEIVALERGLARLVGVLHQAGLAADVAATSPGSGAAGGAGFGCLALGATVVSGADYFLDLLAFDAHAAVSDLVITGEGALDASTASGKVVSAVVARSGGTPVVAVVGRNDLSQGDATGLGLSAVYSTSRQAGRDTAGEPELTTAALTAIGAALAREFAAGSPP